MATNIHQSLLFSSILYLSFLINLVFSGPIQDPSMQVDYLLDLKENLRNTTIIDFTWKNGSNPCKDNWVGVLCDTNNTTITDIKLASFGLSGDFSVESLKGLESIRLINISDNLFTGPLPDFWILGKTLKILDVSNNKFCHPVKPDAFRNMDKLRRLDLSRNKMYGNIPESLTTLPMLRKLNMAHNLFSGPIPEFPQKALRKLDLSYNKLEGNIPEDMTRFNRASFVGNPGLCSQKMGLECQKAPAPSDNKTHGGSSITIWIVLSAIVLFLLLTLLATKKGKNDKNSVNFKKVDDEGHINMGEAAVMTSKSCPPSPGHSSNIPEAELIIVNHAKGTFGIQDLMQAAAGILGKGVAGSAYKAKMSNGLSVVVKRFPQMNKARKEDFDNGMRYLGGLRHKNILPLLAYQYKDEEKLIVSEYIPRGSLMYLLHGDRGEAHAQLTWPIRLKIVKGVAQGLGFLHSQLSESELPHGNLKSCNILLCEDFEPVLNDYAFSPLVNDTQIAQTMFAYKTPEAIFDGRVSPKSDVYCLGVVILEIVTGKYPSQYLSNQSGGTDVVLWSRHAVSEGREIGLIDPEIVTGMERFTGEMEKLLQIGVTCTLDDHDSRIGIDEVIQRIEEIQDSTFVDIS